MEAVLKKENITIILIDTQIPENIGAAARAMNNMGIERLILVNPKWIDRGRMLKSGTIHSERIIDNIEIINDLKEAIGRFGYIVGTTARLGTHRPAMAAPESLAEKLVDISQNNEVAILFGPEDKGLSNEHLQYCHTITTIPTSEFSSLNLAQAVLIVCYEIFKASIIHTDSSIPRLANSFELEGMYAHLSGILTKIGYLNPQNPDLWMLYVRRFFSRMQLRAREVRLIRGICRQIDWYTDKRLKDIKGSDE
ncbi:MAG: RNA methyltransferase [Desulfatiglans sp.]|jgi:tRNA/rRNA methyltransferase|nr:RNA methyltransferase [Desulfatiglans sp.]